ncbi:hypothetical protein [uncultured Thermomonospora sp.]|uniref:hypothetical protein n=1 Tax=uncultured Thermomonospora sp. TaxID=671175 RepID=UPI00259B92DF|nr:hypothetical protein [uncultured Thermomonospora sp.]
MDMRGNPGGAADRRTAEDTTPLVVLWARLCAVPARCVFLPSRPDRIVDPMIRALQQLRAWTGMAVLVGIALTYQSTDTDAAVNQWLEQLVGNLMLSIMLSRSSCSPSSRPPGRRTGGCTCAGRCVRCWRC